MQDGFIEVEAIENTYMKANPQDKKNSSKSIPLEHVLNQNEEIQENVDEAASTLASVNKTLNHEKNVDLPIQLLKESLIQNKKAEQVVTKASKDLQQVNGELAKEVAERIVIEFKLDDTKNDLAEAREDLSKSLAKEKETQQISESALE